MILPSNEKWRIVGYFHGWRIDIPRTRSGRREWEPTKWFGTLDGAVRELGDLMVRTSDAKSLDQALEETKRVSTTLCRALTPQILDAGDTRGPAGRSK